MKWNLDSLRLMSFISHEAKIVVLLFWKAIMISFGSISQSGCSTSWGFKQKVQSRGPSLFDFTKLIFGAANFISKSKDVIDSNTFILYICFRSLTTAEREHWRALQNSWRVEERKVEHQQEMTTMKRLMWVPSGILSYKSLLRVITVKSFERDLLFMGTFLAFLV